MNKDRRARIAKVQDALSDLIAELENVGDEEMEAYENLPESLQYSERGEAMQDAQTAVEEAKDALEEAASRLTDAAA